MGFRYALRRTIKRHGLADKRRAVEDAARDRAWLLTPKLSVPWVQMAGLDYDAVIDRLDAKGVLRRAA